jgi:membrane protein
MPRPSAWRLGGLTVRQLVVRVRMAADDDEILPRAAALSYSFLFSFFPLLLFVAALLSLIPVHHVIRQLMDSAAQVLPDETATAVRATLRQVIASNGHRGLISLGAVSALWVGSTGLATVMSMLNVVCRVRDERPWWKRRGIAMLLTVVCAVFVIASSLLIMLSARLGAALGTAATTLTTVVPVVLVLVAVDLVYYFAPSGRRPWRWPTPGAVTFTVSWLAMSFGLRVYVANFANYGVMYGAIGGLILFLFWLFLTSVVLLIGAEMNRAIAEAAGQPPVVPAPRAGTPSTSNERTRRSA